MTQLQYLMPFVTTLAISFGHTVEAVAKPGGLLISRANPRQVMLYRLEHREALERLVMQLSHFPEDQKLIPTIYRVNDHDPTVLFLVDQFPMRTRDII